MKKLLIAVIGITLYAPHAAAFDKDAFALHLRKALSLDSRVEIKVSSDPVPSGVGNMLLVTATVGGAPYPVFLSPDQKQYIWGMLVDAVKDPDKSRRELINLKNVHSQGLSTATVTVVEFSDMQCSHCKQAHDTLKKDLYKAYTPSQVRLVFKHFPLSGHDWAEPAAVASECAGSQKEEWFWKMSQFFFDNQGKVTKDNVKEKALSTAKEMGVAMVPFEQCMGSEAPLAKVRADKQEGMALGVNSTPTIFVNGRTRRGFRDFEDVRVVIEEKLKEGKK